MTRREIWRGAGVLLCGALLPMGCSDDSVAGGSAVGVGNPVLQGRLQGEQLEGTITSAEGAPQSNVVVMATDSNYNPWSGEGAFAPLVETTAGSGAFTIALPTDTSAGLFLQAWLPDGSTLHLVPTAETPFSATGGAAGVLELLVPDTQGADTAGLRLHVRGTALKGTAGELASSTYEWQGQTHLGMALTGIPYGMTPELRWSRSGSPDGGSLLTGYPVLGDKIQVIGNITAEGEIEVQEIFRQELD